MMFKIRIIVFRQKHGYLPTSLLHTENHQSEQLNYKEVTMKRLFEGGDLE
jgi:hypothetical protein